MSKHQSGRARLASTGALLAVTATLGLSAGSPSPAGAAAPQGYAASDVLGQTDGSGNPVFTTSGTNNNTASPNAKGFGYPQGTALDVAGHRLFAADCSNSRVLVFNLDANNNIISRTASFVIGQANFTTTSSAATQSGFQCPVGPTYDAVHKRLWVPDDGQNRVLEFDISAGISNGMNASHVLGQPNFTSGTCPGTTAASICQPYGGSAYDPVHDRLFVSDGGNRRVLEFDLAAGITDGMNATHVLGQPNFTANTCVITQSGIGYPYGMAYDVVRQLLYIADDAGSCAGPGTSSSRVMVWDLTAGITDGMNAAHILGKASFTDSTMNSDAKAAVDDPEDLSLDATRQHLFVQDDNRNRVLMFDVANITNGEEATAVIGQSDFVASVYPRCSLPLATKYNQCDAEGQSQDFDVANNRLYLSDAGYNRVLIFNFVQITTALTSSATVGTAYQSALQSANAQGVVHYAVTSGSMPPGLTLNSTTGVVSGTPATAGSYGFAVTATDDNGVIGSFSDVKTELITVGGIPVPDTGGAAG